MSRLHENDLSTTLPMMGDAFDAISGQVSGNGICTSAPPREYIMSSCRQAIKSWFWMS